MKKQNEKSDKRPTAKRRPSQISNQDERDILILDALTDVLDGLESASLPNGLSAAEVKQWLRERAVVYGAVSEWVRTRSDPKRTPVR